ESCRIAHLAAGTGGSATGIIHSQFVVHTQVETLTGRTAYGISSCENVQQCDVRDIVSENDVAIGISGRRVQDCTVGNVRANNANHGVGIWMNTFSMAVGNHVAGTKSHGIVVDTGGVATDNVVHAAGNTSSALAIGIAAGTKEGVRIEGNTAMGCGYGIQATAASAMVVRNNARLCDTNFVLTAAMPVVTSAALGTNPNANVSQ
ncbi:MAG TPA: hypothetical protein VJS65_11635, partial [Verrucomicrobiae bacterium]|nr:hypothetical protein [Verrucomicrobiae bacterium]